MVTEEMKSELLDLTVSQPFYIAIHQAEEDTRKEVLKWRTERKQLAASSEAIYASFGYH